MPVAMQLDRLSLISLIRCTYWEIISDLKCRPVKINICLINTHMNKWIQYSLCSESFHLHKIDF